MKTKQLLIGLLLCTSISLYPMEPLNKKTLFDRVVGSIAQSTPMNQLNSSIASRIELQGNSATEELQKMGSDAQTAVGIPPERQLPIRQFKDMAKGAAVVENEAIYLQEDHFNCTEVSYGVKRSDLYHEAVHAKYHDCLGSELTSPKVGLLGALFLTTLFKPQGKLKILYPISMVTGLFAGNWLNRKYSKYFERRADIEGHYATQCSMCVYEKAKDIREALEIAHAMVLHSDNYEASGVQYAQDFINSKKRYLSPDELEQIALDLKQQGKVCTFHNACKAPIINV